MKGHQFDQSHTDLEQRAEPPDSPPSVLFPAGSGEEARCSKAWGPWGTGPVRVSQAAANRNSPTQRRLTLPRTRKPEMRTRVAQWWHWDKAPPLSLLPPRCIQIAPLVGPRWLQQIQPPHPARTKCSPRWGGPLFPAFLSILTARTGSPRSPHSSLVRAGSHENPARGTGRKRLAEARGQRRRAHGPNPAPGLFL